MNSSDIDKLISLMQPSLNIELSDIPSLDLYMDQVIQIFENKFSETLRNDKEKVLTKTMINNYSKDKLLMASKNKKYSPKHMILLSLIYQLKGSLSISDIKIALNPLVKSIEEDNSYDAEHFYKLYLNIFSQDINNFTTTLSSRISELLDHTLEEEADAQSQLPMESDLLTLMSLITMSNLYRRTAEKLIDQFMTIPEK